MPAPLLLLPWALGGISAAMAGFGAKKAVDAKRNYNRASEMIQDAESDFTTARDALEERKSALTKDFEDLGALRLQVEADEMRRFVDVVKQVNDATYSPITLTGSVTLTAPQLIQVEKASYKAADVMKDGLAAVSGGVLAAMGASGTAGLIGIASTGTGIATLSGAAATNATLAWLGGGALSAGGMGIAGGTAVLGGVIAGPALLAMGLTAAAKSEKALTAAIQQESEIREHIEQIENGIAVIESIQKRTNEIYSIIKKIRARFIPILIDSEEMISTKRRQSIDALAVWNSASIFLKFWRWLTRKRMTNPLDYSNFSDAEQNQYRLLNVFGYALNRVIKVQVLDGEGRASQESAAAISEIKTLNKELR